MGRGDLGRPVGFVLDASASDPDRAEDRLEGERCGAAAEDALALFALPLGQDQLGVGPLDGLLEQLALEHLAAVLNARFEASGEIRILRGEGQFEADVGLNDQAALLDLDGLGDDRSLKLLGVRMMTASVGAVVLPCVPFYLSPLKSPQIRAQTGDR